jgi:hypothetical protein
MPYVKIGSAIPGTITLSPHWCARSTGSTVV